MAHTEAVTEACDSPDERHQIVLPLAPHKRTVHACTSHCASPGISTSDEMHLVHLRTSAACCGDGSGKKLEAGIEGTDMSWG